MSRASKSSIEMGVLRGEQERLYPAMEILKRCFCAISFRIDFGMLEFGLKHRKFSWLLRVLCWVLGLLFWHKVKGFLGPGAWAKSFDLVKWKNFEVVNGL